MSTAGIRKVKTSDLELKDRLVSIQRVTKVTKGGRTFSFSAIVVVGNEEGIVGHGLGKANEVTTAIAKGVEDAKKNLIKVPIINTVSTVEPRYISSQLPVVLVLRQAVPCVPCWRVSG